MYLLKFHIEGQPTPEYLHDGRESFIGGDTLMEAQQMLRRYTGLNLRVPLEIVSVSVRDLKAQIWDDEAGGYHILDHSVGVGSAFFRFNGVPIRKE